jgi:N utilization substance protein A
MEKIVNIIESIAHEKGLKPSEANEAVVKAVTNTAKRVFGENFEYIVDIDSSTKSLTLYQKLTVVKNDDERLQENSEEGEKFIAISEAKELDPEVELEDELTYDISLDDMGRTAAAILYRELEYHIQRVIEQNIFENYQKKVGHIVNSVVTRVDAQDTTYTEYKEIQAFLPKKSRIKGEIFKTADTLKAVVRKVYIDKKLGIQVELSRTSPKFFEELLALEVPEIKDEYVIIHSSARIPGERAKVALSTINPNIDPVGATVGTKGVRINAVSKELNGENIDCIEFSTIPEKYVTRALSPALVSSITIEDNKAIVTLPADQKSKAIGRSGINIRLASMLTGFEIELIQSDEKTSQEEQAQNSKSQNKGSSIDALEALFNK